MRRMLAIVCTAATVLFAGCDSDDSTGPTQSSVAGTWNLTTVNGSPLPFTIQVTPKIEVLSDQLVVSANGTFTESTQTRTTNGTAVTLATVPDGGTYSLSGTAVTFIFNDGTTGAGTVSATSLIVAFPGVSLSYQKQ
jgi:Lipocalin-like domain